MNPILRALHAATPALFAVLAGAGLESGGVELSVYTAAANSFVASGARAR